MSNFIKKSITAVVVALASTGVQAAIYDFGVHDPVEFYSAMVPTGSFADQYKFSIAGPLVLDTSVTVANNNPPPISISGGTYQLFSNADGVVGNGDDFAVSSLWVFDGTTGATQHAVALGTGNYYFNITGLADGTVGGIYSITSQISAVPEPETYAMLLAGLGLMGFVARRRKQKLATA